jgi:hypothetical protein
MDDGDAATAGAAAGNSSIVTRSSVSTVFETESSKLYVNAASLTDVGFKEVFIIYILCYKKVGISPLVSDEDAIRRSLYQFIFTFFIDLKRIAFCGLRNDLQHTL